MGVGGEGGGGKEEEEEGHGLVLLLFIQWIVTEGGPGDSTLSTLSTLSTWWWMEGGLGSKVKG